MNMTFILIIALVFILIATVCIIFAGRIFNKKGVGNSTGINNAKLKEANKKLAQNPKDAAALFTVADYFYTQNNWEEAYKTYTTLTEVGGSKDEFTVYCHYGICALKLGFIDDAYKGLTVARSLRQNDFDVNFNLGSIEFQKKNYEKAVQLLQSARVINPEDAPTLRCLGHAFFKLNRHKEAMTFIRQAISIAPDDKESLFVLGECYFEANQVEQALKIFTHLRSDPAMGVNACSNCGAIYLNAHNYEKAIENFEIGLKHDNIKPDALLDLQYRLATTYIKRNDIERALPLLKQIQAVNPGYKDVPSLISQYQELNSNKNLQIFLMGSQADFITLCRKSVMSYYPRARVKITNITVIKNDWVDISAEIDAPKWSDVVAFRFVRSQGTVGELVVRDFHAHLKEVKAGKGICLTMGTFSDEAKRFTEARLIDLIEKNSFITILNSAVVAKSDTGAQKKSK
ncbi:MAG: tetratricopeptide repeat protein [Treponema sp.]|jgi:tetratricopeptide (TPR) repeat protein|nr:tetratricopeptide repeat protein [Treponema sp.]